MNRDEVAHKIFDSPYAHLSAWGQRHVNDVMIKMGLSKTPMAATLPNVTDPDRLVNENERLARELESARIENLDLWEQNSELKGELADLRAQFNLPDDSI